MTQPNPDEFLRRHTVEHRERQNGVRPSRDLRFKLLGYAEMSAMAPTQWLIPGVLPAQASTVIYGESNAFKSFLATDMACSIATGRAWHGVEVAATGNVVFVATEGAGGLGRKRVPAWMAHKLIPYGDRHRVYLWPGEFAISQPDAVETFIGDLKYQLRGKIPLLVVDVMIGTMGGSENKDEVASAWVKGSTRLQRGLDTAVLCVTHSPYGEVGRMRGHSHLSGSFDTRLLVEGNKEEKTCRLAVDRHKDHDSTGRWDFRLETVATDEHPDEDSLVPVLASSSFVPPVKATRGRTTRLSDVSQWFLQALDLEAETVELSLGFDSKKLVRKVDINAVRDRMKKRLWLDLDEQGNLTAIGRQEFARARRTLMADQTIVGDRERVWRI